MNDIQHHFVKKLLEGRCSEPSLCGKAFAPSNIALCKYWGKRDPALNLPINSSLSVSLGKLGTNTELHRIDAKSDCVLLNGEEQANDSSFAQRITAFLDLFRAELDGGTFEVRTENNIPTAAGLASSASGFAALVKALDQLAGWKLDEQALSMFARLGSGSASRSIYEGFVQWHAGSEPDGTDSFAERLPVEWPEFRIGILELSSAPKPVGSRDGMNRTVETSVLYRSWPQQAEADLATVRAALDARAFSLLGKTAENNALSMHATMMSAWPPLLYLQPETIEQIHMVQQLRAEGLELYLTMDAGPNIKLLFLEQQQASVEAAFPGLQTIQPFE